ncbi:MAG: PAS domain S-box-containing protein [Arcticibacterium sp.]|jgi:PAS domain S-box-containing protein
MPEIHQFDAVFLFASEAILITNAKGDVIRVNPAATKLFGYSTEEIIGQKVDFLLPQRYRKSHDGHVKNYSKAPSPRSMGAGRDLFALKKDHEEFPVEVSLSPCELNGEKLVVAFIIDITERKRIETQTKNYQHQLEQEVEDRTLILQEAIEKLENTKKKLDLSLQKERELNQLKSKFISIASHEFRTPLATMLSSVSLIERYIELEDTEKQGKHLSRIKKSIGNLSEILNDILSVNKMDEGKTISKAVPFDVVLLINELVTELNLITKPGQKIELESDLNELIIQQDAKLLSHIITNLLSNAIKFSDIETTIIVTINEKETEVEICVEDEGIGIPETDLQNLFTRFFRSENAGQIQGTGLGLAIVKQYLHLLKGEIICESTINKGSKFLVTLPKTLES